VGLSSLFLGQVTIAGTTHHTVHKKQMVQQTSLKNSADRQLKTKFQAIMQQNEALKSDINRLTLEKSEWEYRAIAEAKLVQQLQYKLLQRANENAFTTLLGTPSASAMFRRFTIQPFALSHVRLSQRLVLNAFWDPVFRTVKTFKEAGIHKQSVNVNPLWIFMGISAAFILLLLGWVGWHYEKTGFVQRFSDRVSRFSLSKKPEKSIEMAFWDEHSVTTQLNLARVYIDMGESELARTVLKRVLEGGSVDQKKEAEMLLSEFAPT
jgi:FimV-like protein